MKNNSGYVKIYHIKYLSNNGLHQLMLEPYVGYAPTTRLAKIIFARLYP